MRKALYEFIKRLRAFLVSKFRKHHVTVPYIIIFVVALIVVVGGINLFIEFTEHLKGKVFSKYDQQITEYIIAYRSPSLTKYFIFATKVGDLYGYLVVLTIMVLISVFIFKKWKYVVQTTTVLALAGVSNMMLKRFVDRARPGIEHLVSVETLSYPSGHAMSAMAFYGFVIYMFYRFNINKYLKIAVITILTILIFSIGISRIYLGVHFPTDIIGGFIAGFIWVIFCILLFDLIEVFRRDPKT
ncbi:MAG: phosphatase PAP2 family protein [Aquaticitalea sp.]